MNRWKKNEYICPLSIVIGNELHEATNLSFENATIYCPFRVIDSYHASSISVLITTVVRLMLS